MDAITRQQHYIRHIEHDIWGTHIHMKLQLEDYAEKRMLGGMVKACAQQFDKLADRYLEAYKELERLVNEQTNT